MPEIKRLPPGIAAGAYRPGERRPKAVGAHPRVKLRADRPKRKRKRKKPFKQRYPRPDPRWAEPNLSKLMGEMI